MKKHGTWERNFIKKENNSVVNVKISVSSSALWCSVGKAAAANTEKAAKTPDLFCSYFTIISRRCRY